RLQTQRLNRDADSRSWNRWEELSAVLAAHGFLLRLIHCGLQVEKLTTIQKYPSRFFCSIDPVSSWSITRPCRSEFRANSISSMIFGSVVALLSIAPVSG